MTQKFTSIESLRHVIQTVRLRATYSGQDENGAPQYKDVEDVTLPKILYRGTVKIHGSNAGVRLERDGSIVPQSRNRDLSIENDHVGFAQFAHSIPHEVWAHYFSETGASVVYGEWCGPGIQSGDAIQQVDSKRFVVFAILKTDGTWASTDVLQRFDIPEHGVFCVARDGIPTFEVEIDFNNPSPARDEIDRITAGVGETCPVGLHFGVDGHGEGIVWTPVHGDYDERFWFKSKDHRHKERSRKTKDPTPIDPEVMANMEEFVSETVNEVRMEKAISALTESGVLEMEISRKHTGQFLKWVSQDVLKEEGDVIEASGLNWKSLSKPVSDHARRWFFQYLDSRDP